MTARSAGDGEGGAADLSARVMLCLGALVTALTFAVFLPSLPGEFVVDDQANLVANERLDAFTPALVRWAFTTFHYGHYQPLSWLSLGLDAAWAGKRPWGFRLTSLALHALNAILVWRLIRRLLDAAGVAGSVRLREAASLFGALCFAWHPLRMESVAYLTERRDLLSTALLVPAVLAYLRIHRPDGAPGGRFRLGWVAGFMALSLLAKAWAVTLPAVLCLLDVWPLKRAGPGRSWRARLALLTEKAPLWGLSVVFAVVAFFAQRGTGWMPGTSSHRLSERLLQAGYGLWFYPLKTVWPSRLSPNIELDSLSPGLGLAGLAAAIGVTVVLLWRGRRPPTLPVAWCAYGLLVSPVLGLFQTGNQLVAGRYAYVAGLPFAALAAGGWLALARRAIAPGARRVLAAATLCLVLALAILTARESRHWRDERAFWSRALALDPRQYHARNNLAVLSERAGDVAAAREHLEAALAIKPAYAPARANRAHLRWQAGDRAGAWDDIERALRDMPAYHEGWLLRARFHHAEGRLDEAEADYARAAAGPEVAGVARFEQALLRGDRAGARGDWPGAHAAYAEALGQDPAARGALHNRGVAALHLGRTIEALADFEAVLARAPDHLAARYHRGMALARLGRLEEAAREFDAVIGAAPEASPLRRQAQQQRAALAPVGEGAGDGRMPDAPRP